MVDVQERLERLADDGTPRGANAVMEGARRSLLVEMHEVPRARSEWRARRGVLVAAVVVLVAAVVASVAVVRDTSKSSDVLPVVSDTTTYRDLYDTSDQPAAGPLYLIPGFVPDGFNVQQVEDPGLAGGVSGSPQWERILGFARFDPAGERALDWFQVSWGSGVYAPGLGLEAAPTTQPADPLAGYRSQGAPVAVHGHEGVAVTEPDLHLVIWEESPGRVAQVGSLTLGTDDLVAIADGLTSTPDGGLGVSRAPDGFVQVSAEPGMVTISPGRDVVYQDAAGRGFGVFVADHAQQSPGANLLTSGAGLLDRRVVDVNGRHAVLGSQINSGIVLGTQTAFLGSADENIQWLAPGNTLVTLVATGLREDEVLAIARGLLAVDSTLWEQFHVVAPGRIGAAPVDPSAPEPELTGEDAAIADVFRTWVSAPAVDTTVSILEDGDALRDTIEQVRAQNPGSAGHTARVDAVQLVDASHALVTFSIFSNGNLTLGNQQGGAVKIDGTWHVSRATYCSTISLGAVQCPPG
jgi:hypothetical protein